MSDEFVPLAFPPWIRWGVRQGAFAVRSKIPIAEGVTKPCHWCAQQCGKYRRTWCSDECSNKFGRVWSWGAVSSYVAHRDDWRCQRCGCDTRRSPGNHTGPEIDHILPVKDGGTDDPKNLRTLCHDCHIAVGYEQRAARKAGLPVQQQLQFATPGASNA